MTNAIERVEIYDFSKRLMVPCFPKVPRRSGEDLSPKAIGRSGRGYSRANSRSKSP